jgi:hypothetical protein
MAGDAEINVVVELQAKVDDAISAINNLASEFAKAMASLKDNVSTTMSDAGADMTAKAQAAGQEAGSQLASGFKDGADELQGHTDDTMSKVHENVVEKAGAAGKEGSGNFVSNFASGLNNLFAFEGLKFLDKIKDEIEEIGEKATKLKTLSLETGDSETKLQGLQYAFASVGLSSERAQREFAQFQRKIEEAAAQSNGRSMFERLGLDPKQMQSNDAMTNLGMVADKIRNLKEASQQTAAAGGIFGGLMGYQLMPLLQQGSAGLKKMEDSATSAGAIIGGPVLEKFHAFHVEMMQFAMTSETFAADFVAPFMDAINKVITGMQQLYAAFERMSTQTKLAIVFGSLVAIFSSAEKALEFFKSRLTPGIFTAMGEALLPFLQGIRALLAIVGLFAAAWQSNFANARAPLTEVGQALMTLGQNAQHFFTEAKAIFDSTLGPALSELSQALAPVLQEFADATSAIASNTDVWDDLLGVVQTLANVIATVIDWLAKAVKWFNDNRSAVLGVAAAITTALAPGLTMLLGFSAIAGIAGWFIRIGQSVWAVIMAVNAARAAFVSLMFSTPILAAIQILFLLIAVAVGVVIANWGKWGETVMSWGVKILEWLHDCLQGFADFLASIANVLAQIPGFELLAAAIKGVGTAAQWSADRMTEMAAALEKVKMAKGGARGHGGAPHHKKKDEEPPDTGTAALGAEPKSGGASEAAREALDAVKQGLEPLKEAIKITDNGMDKLEDAYKRLGTIDSPKKLAAAQAYLNAEINTTLQKKKQEEELEARAYAGAARLQALADATKDPKVKREYHSGSQEMQGEGDNAQKAAWAADEKALELEKQRKTVQMDYLKGLEDGAKTYAQQLSILEKELAALGRVGEASKARLEIEKQILDVKNAQLEAQYKVKNDELERQAQSLSGQSKLNETTANDPTDPNAAQEKAVAQDQIALEQAIIKQTQATNAVNEAEQEQVLLKKSGTATEKELDAAASKLYEAQTAQLASTQDVTTAQLKLKQAQDETDVTVVQTRQQFAQIAQSLGGPLYNAIQEIVNGVNPLQAAFVNLIQQSGSYRDVQRAMTEITQALAQVFDALRPVVDALLGIVMGVVDVFIAMYNVLVDLIRMLGVNVQRINMLNANLNDLNQTAKPLLQITHDLPTMNEYNDGKWGPLIAKQEETNNTLNAGFNQQAVKLGEIAGTLLGIRMAISVMMGQGLFGKDGGIFGMFKNLLPGGKKKDDAASTITGKDGTTQLAQATTTETTAVNANTQALNQATQGTNTSKTTTQQNTSATTANTSSNTSNTTATNANANNLQSNSANVQQNTTGTTSNTQAQTANTNASQANSNAQQSNTSAANDVANSNGVLSQGLTGNNGSITANTAALYANTSALAASSAANSAGAGIPDMGNAGGGGDDWGNVSTSTQQNTQATQGLTTAMNYVADGMQVFKGLSKGGSFAEVLGGAMGAAGTAIGTAMGGPVGGAIGNALGSFLGNTIGGLFGPHVNAYNNPDIDDTQNYGQGLANAVGTAGANGQSFTESSTDQDVFGGKTGVQAVQNTLAQYGSAANAPAWLQPMFDQLETVFGESSGSSGSISHGKNIGDETVTGATTGGGTETRYTTINNLLDQFAQAIQGSIGSLQNLNGAADMNLAQMFGNGVTAVNGGYSVTPGSGTSGTATSVPTTSDATPQVTVNIDTVNGTDPDTLTAAMQPAMAAFQQQLARQQKIATRTQSSMYGRTPGG